jgi:hypothetical protein
VLIVTIVLVCLTIAIAAFVLGPRLVPRRIVFDLEPDRPHPFGYKMAWLAIRSDDTERVLAALRLHNPCPANWESGLGTIYDDRLGPSHVFVSPPVDGWTFVAGLSLPVAMGPRFTDKVTPLLTSLGQHFPDVQYFFSYPLIDVFAWARVQNGKLIRGFAITEDGVVWQVGKVTPEERSLGLKRFKLRGVRGRRGDTGGEILLVPTEAHVIALAAAWGIDPTSLDARPATPALGSVGRVPAAWLPERRHRAAA